MNTVPIVFASDDNYAPYLGVAIHSLVKHINPSVEYRIYILEQNLNKHHKTRLINLQRENVRIGFVNVSDFMRKYDIPKVDHLSVETAFRLLTPRIFPQYEKILYLDSDIIVRHDVAELYNEDVSQYVLGSVLARLMPELAKYIEHELPVSMSEYFNAGVLLINLTKFTKAKIGEIGLEMLVQKRYLAQDQDVLNILSKGKVKYIDPRWNVEWGHLTGKCGEAIIDDAREGTLEALKDPYILHYSTFCKPWDYPEVPLAEYFWREARETDFYEEIILQERIKARDVAYWFGRFLFPYEIIPPKSSVIVYGYGVVGKAYIEQLKMARYAKILAVADKTADNKGNLGVPLIRPCVLSEWDENLYDAILIAVADEEVAREIKAELCQIGISSAKIRWAKPGI